MPYCTQCRSEYREGVEECPVCGQALVEQLPPASPVSGAVNDEPLAVIYYAPDELLAFAVKDALEQAGLPIIEQMGVSHLAYDSLDLSVSGYYSRLLTLESRAEEAKQIVADFLAAYERGDLALSENTPVTPEDAPTPQD
jgi:hypothetical protein